MERLIADFDQADYVLVRGEFLKKQSLAEERFCGRGPQLTHCHRVVDFVDFAVPLLFSSGEPFEHLFV